MELEIERSCRTYLFFGGMAESRVFFRFDEVLASAAPCSLAAASSRAVVS